ncbi:MAG: DNA alkylation repair protein, partial [Burkholderiales bacterium]|nr:DNA alkylation repair protein [Burkholderiales bacterium]
PDFWIRRIAMLHQLGWKSETDLTRFPNYAKQLAPETEFFIRKSIGWALREYAWHDPAAIRVFLAEMGDQLSPLSRREAGKHL